MSDTDICNSALIKVGAEPIISLSDDNKRGRACAKLYPTLRDDMLSAHPWNFAIKRVELAKLVAVPLYDYTAAFQIPSDSLRVLTTILQHDEDWKVEGRTILANATSMKIKYLSRVTDTTLYPPYFREALSSRIAVDLGYHLAQSAALVERLHALYETRIRDARSFDAQEGAPDAIESEEWLQARL